MRHPYRAIILPAPPPPAGAAPLSELDLPLPRPPQILVLGLDRTRVRTVGDLLRLDRDLFARTFGVGQKKVAVLDAWRADVLSRLGLPTAYPPPRPWRPDGPSDAEFDPDQPLLDVPHRLQTLLQARGVSTIGALLELAGTLTVPEPGVSPNRIAELRVYTTEAYTHACTPAHQQKSAAAQPTTLSEWSERFYASLARVDREMFRGRYDEGKSLDELGADRELSRERVRQILNREVARRQGAFGVVAAPLLAKECGLVPGRTLLCRADAARATVPFEALWLPLELTSPGWNRLGRELYVRVTAQRWAQLRAEVAAWVGPRCEVHEPEIVGAPFDPHVVRWVLVTDLRMTHDSGTWRREPIQPNRRRRLRDFVRDADRPVHQSEIMRWLLGGDGAAPAAPNFQWIEAALPEMPEIYRYASGTFVHEGWLQRHVPDLPRVVEWCARRIRGTQSAWSTITLLAEAQAAGVPCAGVTYWVLKHALARRQDVERLRKSYVRHIDVYGAGEASAAG